jgi:hypothetical protein
VDELGGASVYAPRGAQRLLLVHGDFLALPPAAYGGSFQAAWDRGGITSVRPAQRAAYAAALAALLDPGAHALVELIVTNIDMDGAMRRADALAALEGAGFSVDVLASRDVRGEYPDFRPPGLQQLDEVLLLATRSAQ